MPEGRTTEDVLCYMFLRCFHWRIACTVRNNRVFEKGNGEGFLGSLISWEARWVDSQGSRTVHSRVWETTFPRLGKFQPLVQEWVILKQEGKLSDAKEIIWALQNWCSWTVVLEKTLESTLDCKEIKPVHPKGNQPWIFIGRTDDETEVPILWPPDM